jgi:hypothetical protein
MKGIGAALPGHPGDVRDQLGDLGLKTVEIEAKLGLPPTVGIGFVKRAAIPAEGSVKPPA